MPDPQTAPMTETTLHPCDFDGCDQPAVYSYIFDWGQHGYTCAHHQIVRAQQARNIKRVCQFTALAAVAPAPVTRDERSQLIAAKLSAEAEADETRQRSLQLYQQHQQLAAELSRLQTVNSGLEARLATAKEDIELAVKERDLARADLGRAVDELQRVKTLNDALRARPPVDPDAGEQ